MAKKPYEFDTRYSDIEQELEERKNRIKAICFKVCSKCGETKPVFKFSTDKRNTDGRLGICKVCRNKESLEYYYLHKDKLLIKGKEYSDNHKKNRSIYNEKYREDHKEHLKERAREWYIENREAIKERNKKYYREHREACQIRRKLWRIKNKERIREYNREYKRKCRNAI